MRMLACVAAHRCRRGSHQNRPFASSGHQRANDRCETKQAERAKSPSRFERLERGIAERAVADLSAKVVDNDLDWTDVRLDGGNPVLNAVCLDRVEEKSGCRASFVIDRVDHPIQPFQIAASAQTRVIARVCETSRDVPANACTGADHQTYWLHAQSLLSLKIRWRIEPSSFKATILFVQARD